jgi:hypothetical protein
MPKNRVTVEEQSLFKTVSVIKTEESPRRGCSQNSAHYLFSLTN